MATGQQSQVSRTNARMLQHSLAQNPAKSYHARTRSDPSIKKLKNEANFEACPEDHLADTKRLKFLRTGVESARNEANSNPIRTQFEPNRTQYSAARPKTRIPRGFRLFAAAL
jgi:hypothetical protein